MTNPFTELVSVFPDATHTEAEERIELGEMLFRILDGTYDEIVSTVRASLADAPVYREQKKRLPAFTPAGLFRRRANVALDIPTQVVHMDYDGLTDPVVLQETMEALRHDPYVLYAFRSPSWQGIKVGIWTNGFTDDATYKHAWAVAAQYLRDGFPHLALAEDAGCKDVARLCFVSADPQTYTAEYPLPLLIPPYVAPVSSPPPLDPLPEAWDSLEVGRMLACIEGVDDRERWLQLGMALHSSGEGWARSLWDGWSARSPKYNEHDQDTAWKSFHADGQVTMGTVVHLAQAGGWAPLKATLKASRVESMGAPQHEWTEPPPLKDIVLTDLADMLERTYPTPEWLIKGLIPEGLTFLVGSPKSSKTYLAYSLALSLAYEAQRGGKWLEQYDIGLPGPVIYISLEDDEADSRLRIAELCPGLATIPRERMLFVHGFDVPRFNEGLTEWLETICNQYHPSLIVLDPISYLYDAPKKGGDQFGEVKDMLLPLRWLGKTYHCAILGVDHRRKKSTEDVDIFETTYGSNAKIAVADSLLMIVREDHDITLHARVRKSEDKTLNLQFEFASDGTARWLWKGASNGIVNAGSYGELRVKVLEALQILKTPSSITDVIFACELSDTREIRQAVYKVLFRAQKSDEVEKTSKNKYIWVGGDGWK